MFPTVRSCCVFRLLEELLSEKGDRLVALGLVDAEDVAALMPHMGGWEYTRIGINFAEALPGGFAKLAPLLQARMAEQGLLYSQAQLRDFLALLRTRDLVVLAGDSGSGKTSLVRAAAKAIGGTCTIIPVKPNWTGQRRVGKECVSTCRSRWSPFHSTKKK